MRDGVWNGRLYMQTHILLFVVVVVAYESFPFILGISHWFIARNVELFIFFSSVFNHRLCHWFYVILSMWRHFTHWYVVCIRGRWSHEQSSMMFSTMHRHRFSLSLSAIITSNIDRCPHRTVIQQTANFVRYFFSQYSFDDKNCVHHYWEL